VSLCGGGQGGARPFIGLQRGGEAAGRGSSMVGEVWLQCRARSALCCIFGKFS
jgi:hypothetical protein